ncbi:hypothetical protein [Parafrankia sp. FMc2]|uniref:hypothetical protein n=1 Tax=Parafrankia sp. FMc2 TaxID=3233196 RepID=UPI0034D728E1
MPDSTKPDGTTALMSVLDLMLGHVIPEYCEDCGAGALVEQVDGVYLLRVEHYGGCPDYAARLAASAT